MKKTNLILLSVLLSLVSCDKRIETGNANLGAEHAERSAFSFEHILDEKKFLYRNVNGEYILAHTTDNVIDYVINKEKLKEFMVDSIEISNCKIPIYFGTPIIEDGKLYSFYCDDYEIRDSQEELHIKSKFEQPICSIPLTFRTNNLESHRIDVHNTLLYDGKHKLNRLLWTFNKFIVFPERDRLLFKVPDKNEFGFLELSKKISKNFTVHFEMGQRNCNDFVKFCVLINKTFLLYFGLSDDDTLTVCYTRNGQKVEEPIQIAKNLLKGKPFISIAKSDDKISIRIKNKDYYCGNEFVYNYNSDFLNSYQWSNLSVGSYAGGVSFDLFSITVVGKEI